MEKLNTKQERIVISSFEITYGMPIRELCETSSIIRAIFEALEISWD